MVGSKGSAGSKQHHGADESCFVPGTDRYKYKKKKKNEEDSDLRVKKVFHSITIFISKSDIPCLGILNACVEAGIAEGHFCWTE